MNRYAAEGLLSEALLGRQVLVLTENMRTARLAFQEARQLITGSIRSSAASGRERIEAPSGGTVRFRSIASDLRGMAVDVVFLDLDEYAVGEERMYELTHRVARHGEVIRR